MKRILSRPLWFSILVGGILMTALSLSTSSAPASGTVAPGDVSISYGDVYVDCTSMPACGEVHIEGE